MALLFVLGVMNLFWIAALAAFVLLEKLAMRGAAISRMAASWRLVGACISSFDISRYTGVHERDRCVLALLPGDHRLIDPLYCADGCTSRYVGLAASLKPRPTVRSVSQAR